MKRFRLLLVSASLVAVMAVPLWAAIAPAPATARDRSPGAPIAAAVAAVTGIAISPLLATAAYGAYHYYRTPAEQRDQLPWYAQAKFWLPALILVGCVAAKDTLGALLPPGWKQPLDVLETVENKVSGVIAAGAVIPLTMISLSHALASGPASSMADPSLAASGLATLQLSALDSATFLHWLTVPFGVAVFAVVWMASHAINVLILMSPWGGVDAVLKLARLGVLSLVTASAMINPWVGAAFSVLVIIASYFIAGWAFRLTVFGTLFSWDFLTRRRNRFRVAADGNVVFSAARLAPVPPRTYGRLYRRAEGLVFVYRRWLLGPKREVPLPVPNGLYVGRGLFFASIESEDGGVALLLPRYEGHEEELVRACGLAGVREAGLRRAWSWLRDVLVGADASTAAVQVGRSD